MAIGMPKTQREQAMVLVGIVGFAAAGLYWNYVYGPQSTKLATAASKDSVLEENNQKAKAQAAKGTVKQMQEQAKSFAANLALMRQLVPASNEVPTLLDQISTSARKVGLEVGAFQPLGPEIGTDFDAYRYKLSVTGSYHAVSEFLTNIGSLPRIVVPVNVQMSSITNPDPKKTVTTTFEVHTYVAHTSAPAKGGK